MKATVKITKEVKLKILIVRAGVRYWEDAEVNGTEDVEGNLIPCRDGDLWCLEIDIDTGTIKNWKAGVTASVHYKVCDQLGYSLIDESGEVVYFVEDGYVPNTLCPKEMGYGDYIIMDIDAAGKIQNWKFNIGDFEISENN